MSRHHAFLVREKFAALMLAGSAQLAGMWVIRSQEMRHAHVRIKFLIFSCPRLVRISLCGFLSPLCVRALPGSPAIGM